MAGQDNQRQFRRAVMTQAQFMLGAWARNVGTAIESWSAPSSTWTSSVPFWIGVSGNVLWAVGEKASWGLAGILVSSVGSEIGAYSQLNHAQDANSIKAKIRHAFQHQQRSVLANWTFQQEVQAIADEMYPSLGSKLVVELPYLIQAELRQRKIIIDDIFVVRQRIHRELNVSWVIFNEFFPTAVKDIKTPRGTFHSPFGYRKPTRSEVEHALDTYGKWVDPPMKKVGMSSH